MDLCGISVSSDRQVTCGAAAFRQEGRASIAAIVKATFRLADGRAAETTAPEGLVVKDRHVGEDGARSLLAASDIAPFRPRCDVTLVGHACAPRGTSVKARAVRLVVARSGATGWRSLVDRTLVMFGEPGPTGPQPFELARVSYEAARGGAAARDNPVGREAPLLVDPVDETRIAALGPIPPFWPARKAKRGAFDAAILKPAAPDLPAGFPWEFFQAAPADQQIEPLAGDELIQLDGFFADRFRVTTRLPGARAAAKLYRAAPGGQVAELPLALVADTLAIDTDRGTACVVWRARASLSSLDDVSALHLAAGLSIAGSAVEWPSPKDVLEYIKSGERVQLPARAPSRLAGQTVALPDEPVSVRAPESATPFLRSEAAPPSMPVPSPPTASAHIPHPIASAVQPPAPVAAEAPPSPWGSPRSRPKTIGEMMAIQPPAAAAAPTVAPPASASAPAVTRPPDEDDADLSPPPSPEAIARVMREAGASDALVAKLLARLQG